MELSNLFLQSCFCIPLKSATIIIGIIGLIINILFFLETLVSSLEYLHDIEDTVQRSVPNVYTAFGMLFYELTTSLNIIFSIFLLYGAISKSTRKSSFIFSWILHKQTSILAAIIDICTYTSLYFSYATVILYNEAILYFALQSVSCYIIYCYYRTLPKQKI